MFENGKRRPGQGNGARNGQPAVRDILARRGANACVALTGAALVGIAAASGAMDGAVLFAAAYGGLLAGLGLSPLAGEWK